MAKNNTVWRGAVNGKEWRIFFKRMLVFISTLCHRGSAGFASVHEFIPKPDGTQAGNGENLGMAAEETGKEVGLTAFS